MAHQIIGEKKVLRHVKHAVFGKRFVIVGLLGETKLVLNLEAAHEHGQISLLVLSKVAFGVSVVKFEELSLDFAMSQLIMVNLRDGLKHEINVRAVVDIQDLHHIRDCLVNGRALLREN